MHNLGKNKRNNSIQSIWNGSLWVYRLKFLTDNSESMVTPFILLERQKKKKKKKKKWNQLNGWLRRLSMKQTGDWQLEGSVCRRYYVRTWSWDLRTRDVQEFYRSIASFISKMKPFMEQDTGKKFMAFLNLDPTLLFQGLYGTELVM